MIFWNKESRSGKPDLTNNPDFLEYHERQKQEGKSDSKDNIFVSLVTGPLGLIFNIAVWALLAYGAYWVIKAIVGFIKYYAKYA